MKPWIPAISALMLLSACAKPASVDDSSDTQDSADTGTPGEGEVVISELVAKNNSLETDENGDNDD